MKYNEILEELYRQREEHARECGYDIHKIFQQAREATEKLKAQGWCVVSPAPREQPDTACFLHDKPKEQGKP